jgi:hypothetical protein
MLAAVAVAALPGIASAAPASVTPAQLAPASVTAPLTAPQPLAESDQDKPTAVKITGAGVTGDLVVREKEDPDLFDSLLGQVSWVASASPQTGAPAEDKLGAKFTLTVLVGDAPQQAYDVYPLAAGGPRVFRPEQQPNGKTSAGWFYGRLTMAETLRVSGAPLPAQADQLTGGGGIGGGVGGGSGVDGPEVVDPNIDVSRVFNDFQRLFLLNGAVVLAIAAGLAGMSYLIRRKI